MNADTITVETNFQGKISLGLLRDLERRVRHGARDVERRVRHGARDAEREIRHTINDGVDRIGSNPLRAIDRSLRRGREGFEEGVHDVFGGIGDFGENIDREFRNATGQRNKNVFQQIGDNLDIDELTTNDILKIFTGTVELDEDGNLKEGFAIEWQDEIIGELTGRNLQREALRESRKRLKEEEAERDQLLADERRTAELADRAASSAAGRYGGSSSYFDGFVQGGGGGGGSPQSKARSGLRYSILSDEKDFLGL